MAGEPEIEDTARRVGLCASCRNARIVPGAKGATYYLCELSAEKETYPKYPQYPRLPMLSCPGYAGTGHGADR